MRIRVDWSTAGAAAPTFTSTAPTGAWEDHAYSYSPICDQTITTWGLTTNASWLSQNSTTGAVSGTPDNTNSTKSYLVSISAENANGTVWQNYTVTVANNIPIITTTPGSGVWASKTFYYNASADDGNSYGGTFGSLTTNWTGSYSWTASTGKLYFTPNVKGSFWFNINFNDNSGAGNGTINQNFTVTVAKPYYTSNGLTSAWEDHAYSYTPTANTTVTSWGYTTNGGAWISQNSGTGAVYGTPTNTYSEHSYWVNISAVTLYDGTVYQNYSIFVHNYIPHMTTTPDSSIYRGHTYYYNASFDDFSVGGSFSGITSNCPDPYTFDTGTGKLSFHAVTLGSYWFNIAFSDNSGAGNQSQNQNFTVDVVAITFTSSPISGAWEDHAYSYTPTCNETITTWGLSTNASWLAQTSGNGNVHGTPDNANSMHSYYVHISASNSNGVSWQNYTVTVANRDPQFTSTPPTTGTINVNITYDANTDDEGVGTPGGNYSGVSTNFTDPYTFNLTTGVLGITVLHGGSFWFNITADDQTGASNATSWQNFTITVAIASDWAFTSSPVTGAWEDHSYAYTPTTSTLIGNWSVTTNATWLSLNSTTGEVYGSPSNLYAGLSFSVNLMGWDENYTHWQNYSIFVANNASSFSTTPSAIIWIGVIYGYDPTTDDEGLGGHYVLIWDSRLTVSFNATTGMITFNPQIAGTFLFSLTFDDGSGALNATVVQAWTVTVQGPGGGGAGIDVDFTWVVDGNNVTFTVVSTFTSPTVQYLWDFGDGNTSTLMNPTHLYGRVGTYSVTLLMGSQYATVGSVEHSVVVLKMSVKGSIFTMLDLTGQIFVLMMLMVGLALAVATKHPLAIIVAIVFLMLTLIFIVVPFLSSFGFGPLI